MNNQSKRIKTEFIKSFSVMLLALILLITAVLAWFTESKKADVSQFNLTIINEEGEVFFGIGDVSVEASIVLPCATKRDDEDISSSDFEHALHIESFEVQASTNISNAEITVSDTHEELHYYIIDDYDSDVEYGDEIYSSTEIDTKGDIIFESDDKVDNRNIRTIAVVFWAEYDDLTSEEAIRNGTYSITETIEFKVKN